MNLGVVLLVLFVACCVFGSLNNVCPEDSDTTMARLCRESFGGLASLACLGSCGVLIFGAFRGLK